MKINTRFPDILAAAAATVLISFEVYAAEPDGVNWPSFRGPQASGVADGFASPEKWNVAKGENLKWKTAIPGLGHSSPAIWGNWIFITTAVKEKGEQELKVGLYGDVKSVNDASKHSWLLLCLNKTNGNILWQRTAHEGVPKIKRHTKSSHANSTPATDGKHVVAFFGSEGLFCFDAGGKLLWQKDFGLLNSGWYVMPAAEWGFASSPIIHDNLVIVQCDVQSNSFLAAFEVNDGKEIWRTPRGDVPTWSTPTVEVREGRRQVIVNGYQHSGGYDLLAGKELWKLTAGGDIPVPTPVVAHDLIFLTSAHGRLAPIYAVRVNATGDITLADNASTNQHIAWSQSRRGNYMQTPLVYGDYLYCCNDAGILSCYEAKTGKSLYSERLGSGNTGFTASIVAADGKLYAASEEGLVFVVKAGPKFQVLSTNDLGETCMATPAISAGELFFRTRNHLMAISSKK
ncbi:MAG TPA: PQQ-binding-like beta-propeller repeat protein [Candidatus Eisenbacteria bacterium]|nr:PQQ-binding-like beta-propeller repeat protein [Candidatus Eisenbacteria bacterium]